MNDFSQWLENLKQSNDEIRHSVEKLETFFNADGFNTQEFESILNKGLKSIEVSVPKKIMMPTDANN